jgi:hypothetical protein
LFSTEEKTTAIYKVQLEVKNNGLANLLTRSKLEMNEILVRQVATCLGKFFVSILLILLAYVVIMWHFNSKGVL